MVEEGKWLLAVSSLERLNSVFHITNENNSFSLILPRHWDTKSAEKTIDELNKLPELRSEDHFDLHVDQVRKKGPYFIKRLFFIQSWYV